VADVVYLIPLLSSLPEADADRVGMVGVSRGGMMAYLLLQGEADQQVPVRKSRRLAEGAKAAGRPVRLITFPGDDHGLSTHAHGLPETLAWLGLHLGRGGEDHSYERHVAEVRETMGLWPR